MCFLWQWPWFSEEKSLTGGVHQIIVDVLLPVAIRTLLHFEELVEHRWWNTLPLFDFVVLSWFSIAVNVDNFSCFDYLFNYIRSVSVLDNFDFVFVFENVPHPYRQEEVGCCCEKNEGRVHSSNSGCATSEDNKKLSNRECYCNEDMGSNLNKVECFLSICRVSTHLHRLGKFVKESHQKRNNQAGDDVGDNTQSIYGFQEFLCNRFIVVVLLNLVVA